jgi:hypothetical protein
MTNAIGSAQDPALQPAAAAAKSIDAGVEATRKALESDKGEGGLAVQLIQEAVKVAVPAKEPGPRGHIIDKRA